MVILNRLLLPSRLQFPEILPITSYYRTAAFSRCLTRPLVFRVHLAPWQGPSEQHSPVIFSLCIDFCILSTLTKNLYHFNGRLGGCQLSICFHLGHDPGVRGSSPTSGFLLQGPSASPYAPPPTHTISCSLSNK